MLTDIPTITSVVAAVRVMIGVVFTLLEVRHMTRTRRTDVVMRIYEKFESREMLEAIGRVGSAKFENYDEYRKKYRRPYFKTSNKSLCSLRE